MSGYKRLFLATLRLQSSQTIPPRSTRPPQTSTHTSFASWSPLAPTMSRSVGRSVGDVVEPRKDGDLYELDGNKAEDQKEVL